MEALAAGSVVLIHFPYSDLTHSKLRPAVVMADAGRGDFILCQITSNAYSDSSSIELRDEHFRKGSLHRTSFVRPGKLFTANKALTSRELGTLKNETRESIVAEIEKLLRQG